MRRNIQTQTTIVYAGTVIDEQLFERTIECFQRKPVSLHF